MLEHNYIKNKLQVDIETIIQNLDYNIEVNGEVGFYDHTWIKKKFGTLVTPFVLNPITTTISEDTLKLETRQYTMVAMPFAKERKAWENIVNEIKSLYSNGYQTNLNGNIVTWQFVNEQFGVDFVEGSGFADKRFELLITFNAVLFPENTLIDTTTQQIKINDVAIAWRSFKYEHGKTSLLNMGENYNNANNVKLNNNQVVIEAYVLNDVGDEVRKLISSYQGTNIKVNLELAYIMDSAKVYNFDGFTISNVRGDIEMVLLYFSPYKEDIVITVNGVSAPIVRYEIEFETAQKQFLSPNSINVKAVNLSRTIVYGFVFSEENNAVINKIYDDMFDETFDGIYNVVITFNHLSTPKTVEKTLEIKKVSKKGETDNQDAIVVTFTEG